MADDAAKIIEASQIGFAEQEKELAATRVRQAASVITRTAAGSGDIDETFSLDRAFRLVFIRCHFVGTSGTAPLAISVDSAHGSAYDALLFTLSQAGTNKDVHLRIGADSGTEPSPWTFQTGDGVRLQWANPDSGNITWGLEVGLALAS